MENKIWAIIVTYNSEKWIKRCLQSLHTSSLVPKVIVVDNASRDQTVTLVRKLYPEVTVVRKDDNTGFGQACNIGLKYALEAQADYILIQNDDVEKAPDMISKLQTTALNNPEYGILIPLNRTDSATDIDPKFCMELKKYGPPELFSDLLMSKTRDVYEVPVLPGAAMFLTGKALKVLGGFDPLFFVLGVEYDYCFRTSISDLRVGFVPQAIAYHEYKRTKEGQAETGVTYKYYSADFYSTSLFILKNRIIHLSICCFIRVLIISSIFSMLCASGTLRGSWPSV
ncbi:glycosyltransferase family 2 protein [candidate division CSSED10-310 bacterium]|uniref:Glycosyltransferase family 2 protein n=1 Tax=candidate division CSSED10-310 bacterium TaxID=2855610 RepID=A0ABV6Z5H0_UNCC1